MELLYPSGFGDRNCGKITACKYARETIYPILESAWYADSVIEFARNVCGKDANSSEFKEGRPHPVIHLMEDQLGIINKGGTIDWGLIPVKHRKDKISAIVWQVVDKREAPPQI